MAESGLTEHMDVDRQDQIPLPREPRESMRSLKSASGRLPGIAKFRTLPPRLLDPGWTVLDGKTDERPLCDRPRVMICLHDSGQQGLVC